jgi:hypothetical protein
VTATEAETTYGPAQINADDAWATYGTRGEDVRVAVLDTGIDTNHSDLALSNPQTDWAEFNDTGRSIDSQPFDDHGHGTAVSGLLAGGAFDGHQYGVAPDVRLLHARVLDPTGTYAQVVAGMEWAVERDADVITMSLGTPGFFEAFVEPIRNAEQSGAVVVSAAGNQGAGVSNAPGNVYDAVAVGATNDSGRIWADSGGERIDTADVLADPPADWPDEYVVPDVVAPGVNVTSAYTTTEDGRDRYVRISGTSMAAPHVAGAIALVTSATGTTDDAAIRRAITASARKPAATSASPDNRYGSGIVDVTGAIDRFDGHVVGTVVDNTTDRPIENAKVTVSENGSVVAVTRTNETGSYDLSVLPGRYDVSFNATGYEQTERSNVVISANETRTVDTTLLGTAVITGTVTDAHAGTGVSNATVTATAGPVQYNSTTNSDGRFTFGPIGTVNRDIQVMATAEGYNTTTMESVEVNESETVTKQVSLSGTGFINGTVRTATNRSTPQGATVTANAAGRTYVDAVTNGTYRITGVPATSETYTVNAVATAFETNSTAVTITENGTSQDFVLARFDRYLTIESIDAPTTVEANVSYPVETTVRNLGTDPVDDTVAYTVDGQQVRTTTIALAPGEQTTVTFAYELATTGTVQHGFETPNESTVRSLTVEPRSGTGSGSSDSGSGTDSGNTGSEAPSTGSGSVGASTGQDALMIVTNTTVSPTTLEPGEETLITVVIHNRGFATGTECLRLTVGNETVDTARLTIPAGEHRESSHEHRIDRPGAVDVTVIHERASSAAQCDGTEVPAESIRVTAPTSSSESNDTSRNATTTASTDRSSDDTATASTPARRYPEKSVDEQSNASSPNVRRNISRAGLAAVLAALLSMLGLRSRRG